MEDKIPLNFANRAIRQFADNLLGGDVMVLPSDFLLMKTVFRHLGGSWENVVQGGVKHVHLLSSIVQAWGNVRKGQREIEVV